MTKKANGQWHICVQFTNLNKAYPKDSFSMPKIDQLVDATARHSTFLFMNAYSAYNQIKMFKPYREMTSFMTHQRLFYYRFMPFKLKNVRDTYQHLVNKMFSQLISYTIKVQVDGTIAKIWNSTNHVKHLELIFDIMRKYKMKSNPNKRVFEVGYGNFLGFMVSQIGNLEKISFLRHVATKKHKGSLETNS